MAHLTQVRTSSPRTSIEPGALITAREWLRDQVRAEGVTLNALGHNVAGPYGAERGLRVGIEALTTNNAGEDLGAPHRARGWVSPSRCNNFLTGQCLADWLDIYGKSHGYSPDPPADELLDFGQFIMAKGTEFGIAIVDYLGTLTDVRRIEGDYRDISKRAKAVETFEAMRTGVAMIAEAVLWDPEHRMFGAADILVRSDILAELWPDVITQDEVAIGAPDLGLDFHYRVIDVKYSSLALSKTGEIKKNRIAYKCQVLAYSRALGRLQGYMPPAAYILGRRSEMRGVTGDSAMERLGVVLLNDELEATLDSAAAWVRRVRAQGAGWTVLPASIPELRPNLTGQPYHRWQGAVKAIAAELEDPTRVVSVVLRDELAENGITSWRDQRFLDEVEAITGKRSLSLEARVIANTTDGPIVRPEIVTAAEKEWRDRGALELFVDYEFTSGVNDNFSHLPTAAGEAFIFMVGVGYVLGAKWNFEVFTADRLTVKSERDMLDRFSSFMVDLQAKHSPQSAPMVFHWSDPEPGQFASARLRHPGVQWPEPNWFDLLKKVFRAENIGVRGALSYGLKDIAKALQRAGLIETEWGDGVVDGMGAMVGAWRCDAQARESGGSMAELELMNEIAAYNEVDCKVMWEILEYLRKNH